MMNTALSTVTTGTNPSNASGGIGEVKKYFEIHKGRGCASCAPHWTQEVAVGSVLK